jgi:hypothetical protein
MPSALFTACVCVVLLFKFGTLALQDIFVHTYGTYLTVFCDGFLYFKFYKFEAQEYLLIWEAV